MKQRIEISKLEDKVGKNCEKEEEKEKTLKKNAVSYTHLRAHET